MILGLCNDNAREWGVEHPINLDMNEYNAFLKEFYEEGVEQQYARQTVFLDEVVMPRLGGPKHIAGKYAKIAVETMALGGVGSRGEDEDFPEPEPGIYNNLQVALKYHYFSTRVTGPTLELSKGTDGAFDDAETRELMVKTNAFLMNINRNIQHTSDACIARVDATPSLSGGVFAVDRAGNVGNAGLKATDTNGSKFMSPKMHIEIWDSLTGGAQIDGDFRITAVTPGSGSATSARITVTPSPSNLVGGEYIFIAGSRGKDMVGLQDIMSTTSSLYGLDPTTSTATDWIATVKTGATAGTLEPISNHRIEDAITDAEMNSGLPTDVAVADRDVCLAYAEMCRQRRIQVNAVKLSEGWTGYDINQGRTALVSDLWAPPYRMRGIAISGLNIYEGIRPGFIKHGGDVLYPVGRRDTYEANYRWYVQLGCRRRRAQWELQDIETI